MVLLPQIITASRVIHLGDTVHKRMQKWLVKYRSITRLCRHHSILSKGPWKIDEDMSITHERQLETTLASHIPISCVVRGQALPRGSHLAYFNHTVLEPNLGVDGYDNLQAPDISLRDGEIIARRWHGGEITFNLANELILGDPASCEENVYAVHSEPGRRRWSVSIKRIISQRGIWSIHEQRSFLYFAATKRALELITKRSASAGSCVNNMPDFMHIVHVTPILLFRYSALTFNAHLIHYDPIYTRDIERLSERIVQSPLMITMLLRWMQRILVNEKVVKISYQNVKPVFVNNTMTLTATKLNAEQWVASVLDSSSKLALDAEVKTESP